MLNNKTIAVVVPAYNEETQIGMVIESMPAFVDRIIIVSDNSKDNTLKIVLDYIEHDSKDYSNSRIGKREFVPNRYNEAELVLKERYESDHIFYVTSELMNKKPNSSRIILINHLKNGGVGAGISSGYKWCRDNNIDCTAVMAGDGQMDPEELEGICTPVIENNIDYVKGNRLIHRSAHQIIPKKRYIGNSILSIMTKLASGYWRVSDTQTGYTAISLDALKSIDIHKIYRSYGMPNDLLVKLNIANCTIKEIPIKPIYRVGEKSKMKIYKVIPRVSWLLFKSFFKRIWNKYFIRDFHPLAILYSFGLILLLFDIRYLAILYKYAFSETGIPETFLIKFIFLFISGMQFILFAMWMDIQDNERLYKS